MVAITRNFRNEEEVIGFFKKFGEILETQIIRDNQNSHRGCAFVKFASLTEADVAIASLNESCFLPGVSPLNSSLPQNSNSSGQMEKRRESVLLDQTLVMPTSYS